MWQKALQLSGDGGDSNVEYAEYVASQTFEHTFKFVPSVIELIIYLNSGFVPFQYTIYKEGELDTLMIDIRSKVHVYDKNSFPYAISLNGKTASFSLSTGDLIGANVKIFGIK